MNDYLDILTDMIRLATFQPRTPSKHPGFPAGGGIDREHREPRLGRDVSGARRGR